MDCHGLKASQRRVLMDCHVATLLAETVLYRLPRPTASQRRWRVFANAYPVTETACPVFASAAKQSTPQTARRYRQFAALNHGLPRRFAPRRDSTA